MCMCAAAAAAATATATATATAVTPSSSKKEAGHQTLDAIVAILKQRYAHMTYMCLNIVLVLHLSSSIVYAYVCVYESCVYMCNVCICVMSVYVRST